METKSEIEFDESETYRPLPFSLLTANKNQMEKAREIVIKKLQAFIQQLKSEGRNIEIETEDGVPYYFNASEVEDYLNEIEQELSIVDSLFEYRLEWDIKIPIENTLYDTRKLDLIETIINHCFGSIVCQGSFKPSIYAATFVSGKICFQDVAGILLEDYEEDFVLEPQLSDIEIDLIEEDLNLDDQLTATGANLDHIGDKLNHMGVELKGIIAQRNTKKDIIDEYKANHEHLNPQKESLYAEVKHPKDSYKNRVNQRAAHFFINIVPQIAAFPIISIMDFDSYCPLIILGATGILGAATIVSLGLALAASILAALTYIVSWPIAAGMDLLEDCLDYERAHYPFKINVP
ncbi:MAG: hypothetical protein H0T84_00750 [Tatlockia sp.]|nr:hypothetical protein [Tatlockia sp.]